MCPPAASPPADIGFHLTDEQLFMSLARMTSGCPLPENVITDSNPYLYKPSDLPDGIWYFIRSEERKDTEHGFWKAKGEASKIFLDPVTTGWRTTLEYYEGQAPHERKTDWAMQEYTMTLEGHSENSKATEVGTLCGILSGNQQSPNQVKEPKTASSTIADENRIQSTHISDADHIVGQGSTSKSHVDADNETGNLTVTGTLLNDLAEDLPDDIYFSRGDYLELLDLDNPASPSSSSENSSCLSMSSNECFDSLALLRDLDPENYQDPVPKDTGFKYSISASLKPNEVVISPVTSGPLVICVRRGSSPTQEAQRTHSSKPSKAIVSELPGKDMSKHANGDRKGDYRDEGPSSNIHDYAATSSSNRTASPGGEKKAAPSTGRKKKLKKYLCFMLF